MTRLLPRSTITPQPRGSLFERLVAARHLTPVNDVRAPLTRRQRRRRTLEIALDATCYAAVMAVLVFAYIGFVE